MPTLRLGIDASKAVQGARSYAGAAGLIASSAATASKAGVGFNGVLTTSGLYALRSTGAITSLAKAYIGIKTAIDATTTIAGFNDALVELRAVTFESEEVIGILSDKARELGVNTKFTAGEVVNAMVQMSRAGWSVERTYTAVADVLNLAVAANLDIAKSADIVSATLAQFNLGASDATDAVDILTAGSIKARTNVTQLATALSYVGPAASSVDMSLSETTAILGTLSNNAIDASKAGTNLRGIIVQLLAPTEKAKKALADMGLSVEDVDPQMHSLTDIFQKFADAGMRADHAYALFQRRNVAAAMVLKENVGALKELKKELDASSGTAKRMADIMQTSLEYRVRAFRSALEELYYQVGDAGLTSVMGTAIDTMTEFLRVLGGVESSQESASRGMAILVGILQAMHGIGSTVIDIISKIGESLVGWAKTSDSAAGGILDDLLDVLEMMGRGQISVEEFKAAFEYALKDIRAFFDIFLLKPVQKIITELTLAWKEMGKFFEEAWKSPIAAVVIALTKFGADIIDTFASIIDVISEAASYIPKFGTEAKKALEGFSGVLKGQADKSREAIDIIFGDTEKNMIQAADNMRQHLLNAVNTPFEVGRNASSYWDTFLEERKKNAAELAEVIRTLITTRILTETDKERTKKQFQNFAAGAGAPKPGQGNAFTGRDAIDPDQVRLDRMREMFSDELTLLQTQYEERKAFLEELEGDKFRDEEERQELLTELTKQYEEERTKIIADQVEKRRQLMVQNAQAWSNTFGDLATLTEELAGMSKEAFYVHKAAMMAQATVNAWISYSNALAAGTKINPAVGQAMGAIAFAAGMMAVRNIAMQEYQGGRALGGTVGGGKGVSVAENGPEFIEDNGNTFYVAGKRGGKVSPAGGVTVNVNIIGGTGKEEVVQTRKDNGDVDIMVLLKAVKSEMMSGLAENDEYHQQLADTYGISRGHGLRG